MPELTIPLAVTVVPVGWASAAALTLTLAISLAVLFSSYRVIVHTTLFSAWCCTLAALLAISATALAAAFAPPWRFTSGYQAAELAALALSLCPIVALLGAKRPQDKAWNFVVLALWAVLLLPAAETLFLRPGHRVTLGVVRSWFLWGPIILLVLNYIFTRFALASLLAAAGQAVALSSHLPLLPTLPRPHSLTISLALTATAFLTARRSAKSTHVLTHDLDRLWLDFRDCFGAFWALRVQERLNFMSKQNHWPIELLWSGFHHISDHSAINDPHTESAIASNFRGLLRRFVSRDWITARTPPAMAHTGITDNPSTP